MLELLSHMTAEGFIHTSHLVKPMIIDDVDEIVPAVIRAGSSDEGQATVLARM
jgi:hypothetical protein